MPDAHSKPALPGNTVIAEPAPGRLAPIAVVEPILLCAIAGAEAYAFVSLLTGPGDVALQMAGVHVLTLGALALLLAIGWRQGRDTSLSLLALIGGAAAGPIGPLGAGVLGLAGLRPPRSSALIEEWYERISMSTAVDPETRLCEDVGVGRTLDLGTALPQSFPAIMSGGPLGARQLILGLIARQFHPGYLDTLKIALRSPEPGIRVQAAAVATHIGADLRARFLAQTAAVGEASREPLSALALLGELETFLASGLLDEGERKRGADFANHLGDVVIEALAAGPLRLPYARDPTRAAELDSALESLLLARHRYADLRAHRTQRRIRTARPAARLRRIGANRPAREAAR